MNDNFEEIPTGARPTWLLPLMPFLGLILGVGALGYAWFRYSGILNRPEPHWYQWIQPALFGLMGILCLSAAILFILGRASAWSIFKLGLSIVPLVLFSNLVILVARGIQNIVQGNTTFVLERLIAQPQKLLLILVVLIALGLLGSLNESAKK